MPKEQKKRGRRAAEARKKQREKEPEQIHQHDAKGHHSMLSAENDVEGFYFDTTGSYSESQQPFYGLLDETEQEVVKGLGSVLEANEFEDEETRQIFINNFWKECDGKELKIACSQGVSKVLEKVVGFSGPDQLKNVFRKCSGNFVHLVQHRFASHFVESLLAQSALVVTEEVEHSPLIASDNPDENSVTMDSLFLLTIGELLPSIHILLTHPFASHTIRVLLVALSGISITMSTLNVIQSKKKESGTETNQKLTRERKIPESFKVAIKDILKGIKERCGVEDLRSLARDKVGSPTLQLILRIELSEMKNRKYGKGKSIMWKMINGEENAGGESEEKRTLMEHSSPSAFVQNLLYDPIGSRLLEAIVECLNDETFKKFFREHFKERLASLARNETASFVVQRVIIRLDEEHLEEAMEKIVGLVPNLLDRGQTIVIRAIVERCIEIGVDAEKLVKAIHNHCNVSSPEASPELLFKLLSLAASDLPYPPSLSPVPAESQLTTAPPKNQYSAQQKHASLLIQSILRLPQSLSSFLYSSILAQTPSTLLSLSSHPLTSFIIQASLSSPSTTSAFVRQVLNSLKGSFLFLATNAYGSHVVDTAFTATFSINFLRERIADELLQHEKEVRSDFFGSRVWKNWSMDRYKMRRSDWMRMGKEKKIDSIGFRGSKEKNIDTNGSREDIPVSKKPIELARERKAKERLAKTSIKDVTTFTTSIFGNTRRLKSRQVSSSLSSTTKLPPNSNPSLVKTTFNYESTNSGKNKKRLITHTDLPQNFVQIDPALKRVKK